MSRYRRRSKPIWLTAPLWVLVTVLAGWGLWQFAEFRSTLLAQAQPPAAFIDPASAPALSTPPPSAPMRGMSATTDAAPFGDAALQETEGAGDVSSEPAVVADAQPQNPDELTAKALACLDAGRIVEGRSGLNTALALLQEDPRAERIREQLASLNTGVFLGSAVLPEDSAAKYIDIQPGDSFLKFARQYRVPAAFLESINPGLNPRHLKPTTGVKIVRGPFNVTLVKHLDRLDLYVRELYVRSFDAELEEGNYLPRGTYRIRVGAKIEVGLPPPAPACRQWIGFEGIDPSTRDISSGWIYGSAGMRGGPQNNPTGIKVSDAVLQQLYGVLVETHSTLHVLP